MTKDSISSDRGESFSVEKDLMVEAKQERAKKKIIEDFFGDADHQKEEFLKSFDEAAQGQVLRRISTSIPVSELNDYLGEILKLVLIIPEPPTVKEFVDSCFYVNSLEAAKSLVILGEKWNQEFLSDEVDENEKKERVMAFKVLVPDISGTSDFPPVNRSRKNLDDFGEAVLEIYRFVFGLDKSFDRRISTHFLGLAKMLFSARGDLQETLLFLDIFKAVAKESDARAVDSFVYACGKYALNQGLDKNKTEGLITKMWPAVLNHDPQVQIFLDKTNNIWGTKGNFGIADFICHTYASEVDPPHLNELMLVIREIPTTEFSRFEQNRLDGLALNNGFENRRSGLGNLRDFIHDQRPFVHELILAMIKFYETGDKRSLETVLSNIKQDHLQSLRSSKDFESFFDPDLYNEPVRQRLVGQEPKETTAVPAIEILRRLEVNTRSMQEIPPPTSFADVNQSLDELCKNKLIRLETLTEVLDSINNLLTSMMASHEVGIEPTVVVAVSWLEQKLCTLLDGMCYEEQLTAYKQPWFEAILKFAELISSSKVFDEQEFFDFISKVKSSDNKAYFLISQHFMTNVNKLCKIYQSRGREDCGFLWSGNLVHEIMKLVDPKGASTALGEKFAQEDWRRMFEPGYHPGD
ncbi:MAG: hypothetical protein V1716_02570 [Candidatus Uhrbacteria bacterium]